MTNEEITELIARLLKNVIIMQELESKISIKGGNASGYAEGYLAGLQHTIKLLEIQQNVP